MAGIDIEQDGVPVVSGATVLNFLGIKVENAGAGQADALVSKRKATAGDYLTNGEHIIGVTDTSIPRTITLSNADKVAGRHIVVKDESGGAGTNSIVVMAQTGTVDGMVSIAISVDFGALRLYSDGANWFSL